MALKCCERASKCLQFCIHSAKVKVPGGGVGAMFSHFIGLGDFIRNAKLNLSVYGDLIRRVNKAVNIRSRRKRNSYF